MRPPALPYRICYQFYRKKHKGASNFDLKIVTYHFSSCSSGRICALCFEIEPFQFDTPKCLPCTTQNHSRMIFFMFSFYPSVFRSRPPEVKCTQLEHVHNSSPSNQKHFTWVPRSGFVMRRRLHDCGFFTGIFCLFNDKFLYILAMPATRL